MSGPYGDVPTLFRFTCRVVASRIGRVTDFEHIWDRVKRHAGQVFETTTGLPFTYVVPGDFLRVSRDGQEVNRSLSKTNFRKAVEQMPVDGPGDLKDRQGASYTWAILMDRRIRANDW